MIVDIVDPKVETVVLDFEIIEDFEHNDLTDTIQSAQRFLSDKHDYNGWRFDGLRMDWANQRCELDYVRLR